MRRTLSGILLSFSMLNMGYIEAFGGPLARPQVVSETTTTGEKPDPVKLNEAAAIVTALKHCLAMDGSLNQTARLVDAYTSQPDLENLRKDMSDAEKEKTLLYTQGRPDIPDFGFLIPNIWRMTPRDARIKFNSIITLKLAQELKIKSGAYAFDGNCKPVMQGDITIKDNFEHARILMPIAFNDKQFTLVYLMQKQVGYNWQIEDLLVDDVGVTNYVKKDLVQLVDTKGLAVTTKKICKSVSVSDLECD